jgi:hypothetical protein
LKLSQCILHTFDIARNQKDGFKKTGIRLTRWRGSALLKWEFQQVTSTLKEKILNCNRLQRENLCWRKLNWVLQSGK